MNKPRKPQARPLADFLRKTLADAFAKQGFASTELVTRWPEIVGARDRGPFGAGEDPMAAPGRQRRAGARHAGAARRRPDRGRDPAPLGRHPRARQPLLRLAGGRRLRLRQAPLVARPSANVRRPSIGEAAAQLAADLPEIVDESLRQALAGSASPSAVSPKSDPRRSSRRERPCRPWSAPAIATFCMA